MEKIEIIQTLTGYNQHTCLDILNEINQNGLHYGMSTIKGVGKAGVLKLMAAQAFSRLEEKPSTIKKIRCSKDIFDKMSFLGDLEIEEFYAIHLNRNNLIIDVQKVSSGGVSGTIVDNRIMLKKSIHLLASAIIFCHNHPSGNVNPSTSDINITKKAISAFKLIDVTVLDHVIVAQESYYSFADEGAL